MRVPDEIRRELEWALLGRRLDALLERGLKAAADAPPDPAPSELHLELTHRCNLKCVMCEHWRMEHLDPSSPARELGFEALARAASSPLLDGVRTVVLTGGEPSLRHDFEDIAAWLSERFPQARLIALTNLWNTGHLSRLLGRLRARGVTRLGLGSSLDGLGATHDRVRGQEGAFRGLERSVRLLRREFPEMSFGFTFTLVPENARELHRAWEFCRGELGSSLGAQWAVETPGIPPLAWTPKLREAALAGIRRVATDIARESGALRRLSEGPRPEDAGLAGELIYWLKLEEYGRAPRRFPFFLRCTAGERHVMIGGEGEVFFCPVNRARTIGRASQAPLEELWSSPRAEEERAYVASGRCHCWLRCVSTPAVDRLLAAALGAPREAAA